MRLTPVLSLVLLSACRDDPVAVLEQARSALAAKDEAGFAALCEPKAAALVAAVPGVVTQSGKTWKVWKDGRPSSHLLPDGDVVEVVEQGHRAVVVTRGKKLGGQVPMRLVGGQWRIELLEMPQFAEAVRPAP